MRSLRFLPLAYLAGVHGFALFAPYLACAVAITHITWARRRRALRLMATPTNNPIPA